MSKVDTKAALSIGLEVVEFVVDAVRGIVSAKRAKTAEEERAALEQLDGTIEAGDRLVGRMRAELAAGDARVDAQADAKFGEKS